MTSRRDHADVAFLQWALPQLGLRWPGFRTPRRQVWRRIRKRMQALGLDDEAAYRAFLEVHPEEWPVLDGLCRVTISRFRRDHSLWALLRDEVLPSLARSRARLRAWSAGCACGEEAHSLILLWHLELGNRVPLEVVGTDRDPVVLERAAAGRYPAASLKEMPDTWRAAFHREAGQVVLDPGFRGATWLLQDVRRASPPGRFDVAFCRNLAFTYFAEPVQRAVLARLTDALTPGGVLVIGRSERLPTGHDLRVRSEKEGTYAIG